MKDKIVNFLVWVLCIGAVLGIIFAVVWCKWVAYFQRFPEASWWTFFVG